MRQFVQGVSDADLMRESPGFGATLVGLGTVAMKQVESQYRRSWSDATSVPAGNLHVHSRGQRSLRRVP